MNSLAKVKKFVIKLVAFIATISAVVFLVFHPMFYLGVTAHTILASILNGIAMFLAGGLYFFILSFIRNKNITQRLVEIIYWIIVCLFLLVIQPLTYHLVVTAAV